MRALRENAPGTTRPFHTISSALQDRSSSRGFTARGFKPHGFTPRGFTLIEILVVLVIIVVVISAVALRFNINGEKLMKEEARRMSALVRMASEQALIQGRDIGMAIEGDGFSFFIYDQLQQAWISLDNEKIFRARVMPHKIRMDLSVEENSVTWPDDEDTDEDDENDEQSISTPQVLMLSSGEITPFDLYFEREDVEAALQLKVTPDGEREIIRHQYGL